MDITFKENRKIAYIICSFIMLVTNMVVANEVVKKDSLVKIIDPTRKEISRFSPCTGFVNSWEEMIKNKMAGVNVISNNGSPTSGYTVSVRGGTATGAGNPLCVIDGMPIYNTSIDGNQNNYMSLINPNDIKSITVLKDANAGFYGDNTSNGVILLTTRKGYSSKLKVNASSTVSCLQPSKSARMLSVGEFSQLIYRQGTSQEQSQLGIYNTDWNKEIFQTTIATDNYLNISGGNFLSSPLSASFGYTNQDGTLKTDNTNHLTGSLHFSPSLLNNHLKLNFNLYGAINNNRFADNSLIMKAATMNPTLPLDSGKFLQVMDKNRITSTVRRLIWNLSANYQFHGFPELSAQLSLNHDAGFSDMDNFRSTPIYHYVNYYNSQIIDLSIDNKTYQYKANNTTIFQLNYKKHINFLKSDISILAGAEQNENYDSLSTSGFYKNKAGTIIYTEYSASTYNTRYLSLFAKLNWNYDGKYILSASIRRKGYSSQIWHDFPAIGLAWNIEQESFLNEFRSNGNSLKLRANYGITGYINQAKYYSSYDYSIHNYPVNTYTTDLNAGIDFQVLHRRLSGNIDVYKKVTNGVLFGIGTQASIGYTGFTSGNCNNSGIELSLNAIPVKTKDLEWVIGCNATFQNQIITDYEPIGYYYGIYNNSKSGAFRLLNQGYDNTGKPIEGKYIDLNKDGVIDINDYYAYRSPIPDYLFAINSNFYYKKLSVGFSLSANIGNFVYNNVNATYGNLYSLNPKVINNLAFDYLNTGFKTPQVESDYYVENASFLKMDYLNVGYDFGEIAKKVNLKLSATIQNIFTITAYKGVDPEIPNGIDNGFYPRPRIFSIKINLDF